MSGPASRISSALAVLLLALPFPLLLHNDNARHVNVTSSPSRNIEATARPKNYSGAFVFLLYILLALIFSNLVVRSLQDAYRRLDVATKRSSTFRTRFNLHANIAFVSFSLLSFNMLSFLIVSYRTWLKESQATFGVSTIWQWTITSTLFLDFAHAICASSAAYFWVQQALLATLLSALYIRVQGQFAPFVCQYTVPGLNSTFALAFDPTPLSYFSSHTVS